jgi:hypothetical protein
VLVGVVTAASDEGGLALGVRAGRTLPLAPVCAAVGAWLALAPARARGDDLALEAVGRSPWERHMAAIAGGAVIALLAAFAIALAPRVDVRAFYPRAEPALEWRFDGSAFVSSDAREGQQARWRVGPDGAPSRGTGAVGERGSDLPKGARAAAGLATALAGLAWPMIAARLRARDAVRAAIAPTALAALATVLAFQAAAAARAPALAGALPPLFLLVWAASRYRSG